MRGLLRVRLRTVDITDKNKNTLLLMLSHLGVASRLPAVLLAGADLKHTDEDGWTSFHVASREGHAAVVQTLLQHGANVAATDKYGRTALDLAGRDCDDEVKKEEVKTALREHGAKHSLFYAAAEGMVELVADLIKEGANVNEKNHVSVNRVLSASA